MIFDTKEHKEIVLKLINATPIQGTIDTIQKPLLTMLTLRKAILEAEIIETDKQSNKE